MLSGLGRVEGDSRPVYDGSRRTSAYLPLSDGTRVAYDLFLPALKGVPAGDPLPVLFLYTPYLRTFTVFDEHGRSPLTELEGWPWTMTAALRLRARFAPGGNRIDALFRRKWLLRLVKSGYAVFVAERPGTGASFGKVDLSQAAMARESFQILNWLADQPWCDGNVGMFGDSIQAQVQFAAAGTCNPHLKAIMPASTWWDNYSAISYPGGVYNKVFGHFFAWSQRLLDSPLITPVDEDTDRALLSEALAQRRDATTADIASTVTGPKYPYRDSLTPNGRRIWDFSSMAPLIDHINESGVPVCLVNGWYDLLTRDNCLIYANLTVPKRLIIRPTDHSNIDQSAADLDFGAEAQRWFDFWLKGIDNGVMDGPPVHYVLQGGAGGAWRSADCWPVPGSKMRCFFLDGGEESRSGMLRASAPALPSDLPHCHVDYSATTGKRARWAAVEYTHAYPDMRAHDRKGVTFTTPPLAQAIRVVGHPVIHLWLATDAPDLDVFAYLEMADERGGSTYVTEGILRASHRALGPAPHHNLGLPFHTFCQDDQQTVPDWEPMLLVFDLLPTAFEFPAGSCIRVAVAFADADNFDTPVVSPAPAVRFLQDHDHPSRIELPVV